MGKEKKLKEKNLEQSYTIEALQDEIEFLQQDNADRRAKLWEVVCENDRLTMRYEPYRPPGDEHEEFDFYELIEENESLSQNILNKMKVIDEKNIEMANLNYKIRQLEKAAVEMNPANTIRIKNDRWWNFSVELWPGAWGLNYYRYDWKKYGATSREGQMQIGPFGFSWNREPKR